MAAVRFSVWDIIEDAWQHLKYAVAPLFCLQRPTQLSFLFAWSQPKTGL